ncbi:MAG: hypothetical protein AAB766_00640 [Patescibacteria group bacterium]
MFGFFRRKNKDNSVLKAEEKKPRIKNSANGKMTSEQILATLNKLQKDLDRLKLAVGGSISETENTETTVESILAEVREKAGAVQRSETEKMIEGVFDGQSMVGADGEFYDVPANYASKSKLVEGDIMKLTINNLGAFVYKQIKPIERTRKIGVLDQDQQNLQFYAVAEGKKWKLLTASVTYFKGEVGDEVIFLIPAESGSHSAAVENIIKSY